MKVVKINGELAWSIVYGEIKMFRFFKSLSGKRYDAATTGGGIAYKISDGNKGIKRNKEEEEYINRQDFIEAFEAIKDLKDINTDTIKKLVPKALYNKITPFIGLLHSAGVIKD